MLVSWYSDTVVRSVSFTSGLRWELPICAGKKEIPRTDRGKGGMSIMFQCFTAGENVVSQ